MNRYHYIVPEKLLQYFSYLLGLAAVIIAALIIYWSTQSPTAFTIYNNPFPVMVHSFDPSKDSQRIVVLHLNYCKKTRSPGVVVAKLVGPVSIIFLPLPNDPGNPPMCGDADFPLPLSARLSPGTYHFEFTINYRINPLKDQMVSFKSQNFTLR